MTINVKCVICGKFFECEPTDTKNLLEHLRKHHPDVVKSTLPVQPCDLPKSTCARPTKPKPKPCPVVPPVPPCPSASAAALEEAKKLSCCKKQRMYALNEATEEINSELPCKERTCPFENDRKYWAFSETNCGLCVESNMCNQKKEDCTKPLQKIAEYKEICEDCPMDKNTQLRYHASLLTFCQDDAPAPAKKKSCCCKIVVKKPVVKTKSKNCDSLTQYKKQLKRQKCSNTNLDSTQSPVSNVSEISIASGSCKKKCCTKCCKKRPKQTESFCDMNPPQSPASNVSQTSCKIVKCKKGKKPKNDSCNKQSDQNLPDADVTCKVSCSCLKCKKKKQKAPKCKKQAGQISSQSSASNLSMKSNTNSESNAKLVCSCQKRCKGGNQGLDTKTTPLTAKLQSLQNIKEGIGTQIQNIEISMSNEDNSSNTPKQINENFKNTILSKEFPGLVKSLKQEISNELSDISKEQDILEILKDIRKRPIRKLDQSAAEKVDAEFELKILEQIKNDIVAEKMEILAGNRVKKLRDNALVQLQQAKRKFSQMSNEIDQLSKIRYAKGSLQGKQTLERLESGKLVDTLQNLPLPQKQFSQNTANKDETIKLKLKNTQNTSELENELDDESEKIDEKLWSKGNQSEAGPSRINKGHNSESRKIISYEVKRALSGCDRCKANSKNNSKNSALKVNSRHSSLKLQENQTQKSIDLQDVQLLLSDGKRLVSREKDFMKDFCGEGINSVGSDGKKSEKCEKWKKDLERVEQHLNDLNRIIKVEKNLLGELESKQFRNDKILKEEIWKLDQEIHNELENITKERNLQKKDLVFNNPQPKASTNVYNMFSCNICAEEAIAKKNRFASGYDQYNEIDKKAKRKEKTSNIDVSNLKNNDIISDYSHFSKQFEENTIKREKYIPPTNSIRSSFVESDNVNQNHHKTETKLLFKKNNVFKTDSRENQIPITKLHNNDKCDHYDVHENQIYESETDIKRYSEPTINKLIEKSIISDTIKPINNTSLGNFSGKDTKSLPEKNKRRQDNPENKRLKGGLEKSPCSKSFQSSSHKFLSKSQQKTSTKENSDKKGLDRSDREIHSQRPVCKKQQKELTKEKGDKKQRLEGSEREIDLQKTSCKPQQITNVFCDCSRDACNQPALCKLYTDELLQNCQNCISVEVLTKDCGKKQRKKRPEREINLHRPLSKPQQKTNDELLQNPISNSNSHNCNEKLEPNSSKHKTNINELESEKYIVKKSNPLLKSKYYRTTIQTSKKGKSSIFCPNCKKKTTPIIKSTCERISSNGLGAACMLTFWPCAYMSCNAGEQMKSYLYCSRCDYFLGISDLSKTDEAIESSKPN